MPPSPFFRLFDEVGHDPRRSTDRPKVFPNTRGLSLEPVDRPWARWEGGALGTSGVDIWRVQSTGHSIDLEGASRWSYHLPLRGGMQLTFGNREREVLKGNGAVLGPRRRRTQVLAGNSGLFDGVVVLLKPPEELGLNDAAGHGDTGLVTAEERGALASYLRYLYGEISNPGSAIHNQSALQAAGALLRELYGTTTATEMRGAAGSAGLSAGEAYVRHAEEVMRARFAEPLTIPEIAQAVGVGPRALQLAFAEHRKASPRQVLSMMRLEAARDTLLTARPADTVTSIALDCGFAHIGRFALAYAARFGELPSETLKARNARIYSAGA